jgi:hypothetical protein
MCGSDALIFFTFVDYRPSRRISFIDDTIKRKPPKWQFMRWPIAGPRISKLRSIAARSLRRTSIGDGDYSLHGWSTGISKLRSIAGKSLRSTSIEATVAGLFSLFRWVEPVV